MTRHDGAHPVVREGLPEDGFGIRRRPLVEGAPGQQQAKLGIELQLAAGLRGKLPGLADAAGHRLAEQVAADVRGTAPRWPLDPATTRSLMLDGVSWYDSECAALTAAVAQASRAGLDELAWELAARSVNYFAPRGLHDHGRTPMSWRTGPAGPPATTRAGR